MEFCKYDFLFQFNSFRIVELEKKCFFNVFWKFFWLSESKVEFIFDCKLQISIGVKRDKNWKKEICSIVNGLYKIV